MLANGLRGRTNGLETEVTVRPTGWMRWQASWTMFDKHLEVRPGSGDLTGGAAEGNDPPHQLGVSHGNQPAASLRARRFSSPRGRASRTPVPAYTELDIRASWALSDDVEVAVIGRNLLHASHPEFGRAGPRRVEIERSLYARARASF